MALPQDGQNANGLTKVTEVPTGKELIFVDPTTNEGGIITLEDLTTQILNKLTSKIFTLDQGNITLIEALNKLNSNTRFDVTVPDNVSIASNISIKVGRVVYIAVKIKITGALSSEEVLRFSSNATNESTTFAIGKGIEWNINEIIYGYIGKNSIVVSNKNVVAIGDYLHINTVLIL